MIVSIIIVSNKEWHRKYVKEIATRTNKDVIYIDNKECITYDYLHTLQPEWVFFPHWSYIIPAEVYVNMNCVIFHMTDLPFGRGGSPLQNLIARGIYETKLSALKCTAQLDAGDIYIKQPLSLWGTAEEIYLRAAELTKEMIIQIVKEKPQLYKQQGEPVVFQRRKPSEGDVGELDSLAEIFDYIRMLDADTYPPAFLDMNNLHIEFTRASLKDGHILADAKIFIKH